MIERWATMLCLALALASPPAHAATAVISGVVTYRERIALPPGARLEVILADVSRADAPSRTLARTTVRPKGVLIPYRLTVDRAAIQPGRSYALQAKITVRGRLWFTTTTRHAVFGDGPDQTDIMVHRVAADAEPLPGPEGRWLAEDIAGGGVIDRLQTILELRADGTVGGSGGCNGMMGRATLTGDRIAFGNLAVTQKACSPAVMNQESRFFAALGKAATWRVDPRRNKLTLLDDTGRPVVVFSRM